MKRWIVRFYHDPQAHYLAKSREREKIFFSSLLSAEISISTKEINMTQKGESTPRNIFDENRERQFMQEVIRFCSHIPNLDPDALHALAQMKAIEGSMETPASRIMAIFKYECTECGKGFDIPGTDIDPDSDRTLFCPFCRERAVTDWSNEF